jgi:hypothetical protein
MAVARNTISVPANVTAFSLQLVASVDDAIGKSTSHTTTTVGTFDLTATKGRLPIVVLCFTVSTETR